ncbi:MAG: adenylosuccinate synthase [Elusimicrobia bacterium RIFCSPLOWO2_12_FULL_59_9]|nr:MAG: adenylosuccinate synthase [Elusimicrobia bacterium RIFCSPLOWO2_12_FULL_59_9]
MPVLVVVGAQWGDEGKGKLVHYLSRSAHAVVRYQGGNNAGHTVVHRGETLALHLLPSGILLPGKVGVLAHGVVISPRGLLEEIRFVKKKKISVRGRLRISLGAHVVMPYHMRLDALRETTERPLGTTRRGIGPCYIDKVARRGIQMADFIDPPAFRKKLDFALESNAAELRRLGKPAQLKKEALRGYRRMAEELRPYCVDTVEYLHQGLSSGKRILFEGAQGVMLDLDVGTYPFVTSSSPVAGGACVGAGLAPRQLDRVLGVAKAYTTRVGAGPFPTEMPAGMAGALREKAGEYGATTGRPRRIGWLDLVQLRRAVKVGGLESLALTKLDVLSGIHPLKICVAYRFRGKPVAHFPVSQSMQFAVEPVYELLPGFSGNIRGLREFGKLPPQAKSYVRRVERLLNLPISFISTGPGAGELILRGPKVW